ncbi:MAG: hypothetical protein KZQ66_11265, partial [Candidatus Thiodiazotropha sp. (ex Lucinoma aequizonata)]|nr:hypothetical protein [Candidatus Thiodiazotropha sp. (ex Lucinoma aequizonata)]
SWLLRLAIYFPLSKEKRNYSAALYLRLLNSYLIGFLALAKERVRLLPFGWHPGTQLLGAHLNSYRKTIDDLRLNL